ncbi:MAG TPA: DUF1850 domain-containing protein [Rectinemataceae bacterium]|nr:DUF1850 domain-containing protein [Rectinemataceae bacterium]
MAAKRWAALALAVPGLAAFLVLAHPRLVPLPELLVSEPGGRLLAAIELPDGRFDHVFVHSVHRSEVVERFAIEASGRGRATLRLYELRYENQGVGMPSDAEGGYRLEDGRFVLSMDRRFEKIPIFVSVLPGHGLLANGAYLPFRNWARPETLIVLSAKTRTHILLGR